MKLNEAEFRRLQKEWYEKLENEGFVDIEEIKNDQHYLAQSATHSYRYAKQKIQREAKEQYYHKLQDIIENRSPRFINDIHQYIMTRHAQGAKTNEISKELITRGTPRDRVVIGKIITRYVILWRVKRK